MSDVKPSTPKATTKAGKRERKERRFQPTRTTGPLWITLAGMAGALALGAGVFGQWIREVPLAYAPYLVIVGALVVGGALWFSDSGAVPVRVGDAGVAIEKGSEVVRLIWCDIERIFAERGNLVARGDRVTLSIPLTAHPVAARWVVSEAARRIPEKLDVKSADVEKLPAPTEQDGELLPVEGVQVAGRRCAASQKIIAFERDARLCPNCGQVYHKDNVPKNCLTCRADVAGHALRA